MFTILPILCFISTLLIFKKSQVQGWRGSFLLTALLWGVLATAITEFLSLFSWLSFWPMVSAWGFILLLLILILAFSNPKNDSFWFNLRLPRLSRFESVLLIYIGAVVIGIGLVAWAAPPNTGDSMNYHMSRVMHWIQDKSVAFYPTNIPRQLDATPWGEFAILQFQILNGNDRFANFIQWFSMVASIIGVSLIAKELKATVRQQLFAAIICVTIPMAILQGSSTQTDFVISFYLVACVYFSILLRKKESLVYALATGAALGLGFLTKANMYLFSFPFMAWLGIDSIKNHQYKKVILIALSGIIAICINLGFYVRNYTIFNSPFGTGREGAGPGYIFANETFSIPEVTSNLIRNISLHFGTPNKQHNIDITNAIVTIHHLIGISANDPRTTQTGKTFKVRNLFFDENTASNPIQLLLITASLIFFAFQRPRDNEIALYVLSILLGFLLFCIYLKWQPFNSRLQLPLFILFVPFVSLMLTRMLNERLTNFIMVLLMITALPWVFVNTAKPVFGQNSIFTTDRTDQYFTKNPTLAGPYIESTNILSQSNCKNIGLVIGFKDWEYPLWVMLDQKTAGIYRLEHVNVTNSSQRVNEINQYSQFTPCAIFTIKTDPPKLVSIGDREYKLAWSSNPAAVYTPSSEP